MAIKNQKHRKNRNKQLKKSRERNREVLAVACLFCGAKPGNSCKSRTGKAQPWPHKDRKRAARLTGEMTVRFVCPICTGPHHRDDCPAGDVR